MAKIGDGAGKMKGFQPSLFTYLPAQIPKKQKGTGKFQEILSHIFKKLPAPMALNSKRAGKFQKSGVLNRIKIPAQLVEKVKRAGIFSNIKGFSNENPHVRLYNGHFHQARQVKSSQTASSTPSKR